MEGWRSVKASNAPDGHEPMTDNGRETDSWLRRAGELTRPDHQVSNDNQRSGTSQ
jgi:hypothetical protein